VSDADCRAIGARVSRGRCVLEIRAAWHGSGGAQNGQQFLDEVHRETGLELEIIRPNEEARLAVISCASLVEPASKQVLIVDIGGGSTELVWIDVSTVPPEQRAAAILKIRPSRHDPRDPLDATGARVVDWISM